MATHNDQWSLVVPVKRLEVAKSRIALSAGDRADLALAMELARRTAVAIDNSLIYRSSIALRLEAEDVGPVGDAFGPGEVEGHVAQADVGPVADRRPFENKWVTKLHPAGKAHAVRTLDRLDPHNR